MKNLELDQLKFAYEFHKTMDSNGLMLAYEGEVTQQLTKAFSSLTETNLEKESESYGVRQKVFHIMVECLQNIAKHSDEVTGEAGKGNLGNGIFLVSKDDTHYSITTGNPITNDKIDNVRDLIDQVNSLDRDDLRTFYKKMLKETKLSEKSGAGLGFIDMAKKTGSKITYHFEPISDESSYFLYKIKILRK